MKTARWLVGVLGFLFATSAAGTAQSRPSQSRLANQHLTAITLIQRFTQAIYRLEPAPDRGCPETPLEYQEEPPGSGILVAAGTTRACTRYRITRLPASAADFDIRYEYSNGIRETITARAVEFFNEAPGKIHLRHEFSTRDQVEYDQEVVQLAITDPESGEVLPGFNFNYGIINRGQVRLTSGHSLTFELRQTVANDCFDPFTGAALPEEECAEWFILNPDGSVAGRQPDRLRVQLDGPRLRGSMALDLPVDNNFGILDRTRNTTGALTLDGQAMNVTLTPREAGEGEFHGWKFWHTNGPGYEGAFELGTDFSGRGQAFRRRGRVESRGRAARRDLHFAARWNKLGIGTVILKDGQTRPGGPTSGALEFATLKWSGLSSAFGPSPGGL